MIFIALAVKLTSRGPVFFKQRRYGLNGKQISVWKFRSMTVLEDGDTVTQATKGDADHLLGCVSPKNFAG